MLASLPAVEKVVNSAADAGVFQGEVLIARNGEVLHEQAVGAMNDSQPHAVGTTWRWASVTKQIVAVLVMQEVERGHLSLDATLRTVLPSFKGPTRNDVTLRMLLQHTSGLPNPDDTPLTADGGMPSFYSRATPSLSFCEGPVTPRGTGFSYNNCDYLVLGAVLERVTKTPWATLVKQRFKLQPAFTSPVVGYDETGAHEPPFELASFGAAGALGGTLRELLRFDESLRTGALLKPKSLEVLWAGVPALGYQALGQWSYQAPVKGCSEPVELIERRGEIGGVQVVNVIAPARGTVVLLFSNTSKTRWGDVWRGEGLLHDTLAATMCSAAAR